MFGVEICKIIFTHVNPNFPFIKWYFPGRSLLGLANVSIISSANQLIPEKKNNKKNAIL